MKKEFKIKIFIFISQIFVANFLYGLNTIYVVDARNLSFSDKNLLASAEGIINKKSSDSGVFILFSDYDNKWLQELKKYNYNIISLTKDELLNEFQSYFSGVVLYNGTDTYSRNIGATIAGINDALLSENKVSGFPVIFDCRGRWISKLEAYQWAIDNLMDKVNKNIVADLSYSTPNLLDFIIENKVFVFDLDPLNNSDEINLLDTIFSKYYNNTIVIGWPDSRYAVPPQNNVDVENAFMNKINSKGMVLAPSDFAANLSLYKKISPSVNLLQYRKYKKYIAGEKYITFIMSDGDNIQFILNYMFNDLWNDSERENIPLGWSLSPLLYNWGGFILQVLFLDAHNSKNDEFIASPSGYTYIQPASFNSTSLPFFLKKSKDLSLKMDEWHSMIIDSTTDPVVRGNIYKNYASVTHFSTLFLEAEVGIRNIIKDNNNGILVHSQDIRGNSVFQLISDIRSQITGGKDMIYIYVHSWDVTPSNIKEVIDGISDLSCNIVTPSTFSDLWLQKNRKNLINIGIIPSLHWVWKTQLNNILLTVSIDKSDLPVASDNIVSSKVVYYINSGGDKFFQYMREENDKLVCNMLIPDDYKNKRLSFYLEFITSDSNFYQSSIYNTYQISSYTGPKISWIESDEEEDSIYSNQFFNFGGGKTWDENDVSRIKLDYTFLYQDNFSTTNEVGRYRGGRFADGTNFFIYRFKINKNNKYKLDLRIGNNYDISISSSPTGPFETILSSQEIFNDDIHDLSNLLYQSINLSDFLSSNTTQFFLKIADGSPADGWGGKCAVLELRKIPTYTYLDTVKFRVYTDNDKNYIYADFTSLGGSMIASINNGKTTNIYPFSCRLDFARYIDNGIYSIPIIIYNYNRTPYKAVYSYLIQLSNEVSENNINENFCYISGNGFSPNQDGVNDTITFYAPAFYKKFIVKIYNIQGKYITTLESNKIINNKLFVKWDGKKDGKVLETGVYLYKLMYGIKKVSGSFIIAY